MNTQHNQNRQQSSSTNREYPTRNFSQSYNSTHDPPARKKWEGNSSNSTTAAKGQPPRAVGRVTRKNLSPGVATPTSTCDTGGPSDRSDNSLTPKNTIGLGGQAPLQQQQQRAPVPQRFLSQNQFPPGTFLPIHTQNPCLPGAVVQVTPGTFIPVANFGQPVRTVPTPPGTIVRIVNGPGIAQNTTVAPARPQQQLLPNPTPQQQPAQPLFTGVVNGRQGTLIPVQKGVAPSQGLPVHQVFNSAAPRQPTPLNHAAQPPAVIHGIIQTPTGHLIPVDALHSAPAGSTVTVPVNVSHPGPPTFITAGNPQQRLSAAAQHQARTSTGRISTSTVASGITQASAGGRTSLATVTSGGQSSATVTNVDPERKFGPLRSWDTAVGGQEKNETRHTNSGARRYTGPTLAMAAIAAGVEPDPSLKESKLPFTFVDLAKGTEKEQWEALLWDEATRCFSFRYPQYLTPERQSHFYSELLEKTPWLELTGKTDAVTRKTFWWTRDPKCTCKYTYGSDVSIDPTTTPPNSPFSRLMETIWKEWFGDMENPPNSVNLNLYETGEHAVGSAEMEIMVSGVSPPCRRHVQMDCGSALARCVLVLRWHADDESLFDGKVNDARIISVSLGGSREFWIANKTAKTKTETAKTKLQNMKQQELDRDTMLEMTIHSGDLVTMEGRVQKHTLHFVPRERTEKRGPKVQPRINLTFRDLVVHKSACELSHPSNAKSAAKDSKVQKKSTASGGDWGNNWGSGSWGNDWNDWGGNTSTSTPQKEEDYSGHESHRDFWPSRHPVRPVTVTRWTRCEECGDDSWQQGRRCIHFADKWLCRMCCIDKEPKFGAAQKLVDFLAGKNGLGDVAGSGAETGAAADAKSGKKKSRWKKKS